MKYLVLTAIFLGLISTGAEARQRHVSTGLHPDCNITMPCEKPYASSIVQQRETRGKYVARQMGGFGGPRVTVRKHEARRIEPRRESPVRVATTIVAHPEGCPRSAFCGCGAAVKVFGHSVRELWLAANWFKFPRAMPAPGMVAVRRHHVFVLEQHLDGNTWLAYDANSGGHATRIHARSISGYTIVNPRT